MYSEVLAMRILGGKVDSKFSFISLGTITQAAVVLVSVVVPIRD